MLFNKICIFVEILIALQQLNLFGSESKQIHCKYTQARLCCVSESLMLRYI